MQRTRKTRPWTALLMLAACNNGAGEGAPVSDGGPEPDPSTDAAPAPADAAVSCLRGEKRCSGDRLQFCQDGRWALERDCSVDGQICEPLLGGPARCTDAETPEIRVPELRSFTLAEATALGESARGLRVVVDAEQPTPMAWSMVNASCQDRCMALQYALAVLDAGSASAVMNEAELTTDGVLALAESAADVVATLNLAGPLVTEQTLVLPDGTQLQNERDHHYWPYYHAAVLRVGRELRVLDLSLGNEPVTIEQWTSGFVDPSVECFPMDEVEFQRVWTYWNSAFSNFVPGERPARACGYTITPVFTFRWDQEPQAEFVKQVPATMVVQYGGLQTLLQHHGVELPAEDVPLVLSNYVPLSEQDVCEWTDMVFCSL